MIESKQRDFTPADWDELEPLIDRVLDALPADRAGVIAELVGDDMRRRARLEILASDCERADPLLDRPAAERFATLLDDETAFPEALAPRYRVTRELARGGMATVYLVNDVRHGRDVAVKIMRTTLPSVASRQRFLREIAIAAQLRHPHIVPLFDSGEVDGLLYYVMPYETGRSLRDRLASETRLPLEDAFRILHDVCDALAYAHQHGIVHRDIKPDNVLLSGRHAMVADFGVARAFTAAVDEALTTAGRVVGTPAYMAPEQGLPGAAVDLRADIYSVGVMAFEMLIGARPMKDTPPTAAYLTRSRPEVPAPVAELFARCLAQRPQDRPRDAEEIVAALAALTSGERRGRPPRFRVWHLAAAVAAVLLFATVWALRSDSSSEVTTRGPPQLAVLVFQHGGNAELEPLALGLTDNLIAALGSVPGLHVRSLNAVLPYRDSLTRPDTLGRRLDVSWLVGGALYRIGSQIHASVSLTDASTGRQVDRSESRVASGEEVRLIEELVPRVATMLRARVGDEVRVQSWRAGTSSDRALAAVNRAHVASREANHLAALRNLPDAWRHLRSADSALQIAAQADRDWAEPPYRRALLAINIEAMLTGSGYSLDSVAAVLERGIRHANAALRLDPAAFRIKEVLGILLHTSAEATPSAERAAALRDSAERLLRQATEGDTTLVSAATLLSTIYFSRGEYDVAYAWAERAYRADAYYRSAQELLSRLFLYSFEAEQDLYAQRWCREYALANRDDWYSGYCHLTLMIWDSTISPNADSAEQLARVAIAAAPKVIRPAVAAQLNTLLAGVWHRAGLRGRAGRQLTEVARAVAADTSAAFAAFATELLEIAAAVRLQMGQSDAAVALTKELLRRDPRRAARLLGSRRFRLLPAEPLQDARLPR